MHKALEDIPVRILNNAMGALTQANTLAVYHDPGMEHRNDLCVLSAALAGELFFKAIIADEHPLLLFKDLFHLDQPKNEVFDIERTIGSGRTYGFDHLPQLLWVTRGERLPDPTSFEAVRVARNSVQHFCTPVGVNLRTISLNFIYKNLDPLIKKYFDINAIEYHEDLSVSYDYVVSFLIGHELEFSIPDDFCVTEINLKQELSETSSGYQSNFGRRLLDAEKKG